MFSTAHRQPGDSVCPQHTALPLFDHRRLSRELEFDDSALLQELFGQFLLQLTELQQQLAPTSASQPTLHDIKHFSHRLKSSSHAVGAMQLSDCLHQLEQAAIHDVEAMPPLLANTRLLVDNTHAAIKAEINRLAEETHA